MAWPVIIQRDRDAAGAELPLSPLPPVALPPQGSPERMQMLHRIAQYLIQVNEAWHNAPKHDHQRCKQAALSAAYKILAELESGRGFENDLY